jgi:penicillin-binding protein 1A
VARYFLIVGIGFVVVAMAAAGGVVALFYYYGRDLPDYKQLADYDPPVVTRIHAADGQMIAEYATEKRVFVPLKAMPRLVINAFLSAEDKNFYQHFGLDPLGVLSALAKNVMHLGEDRRLVGASTITQQVAKNFLLTNEVSFARKVKEAILAIRIERAYSKDRILELYLNQIYLGAGSYGVAAAALDYFNKSLNELDVAEAAYLAALPKAPNNYNPVRNHEAAIGRRNWVISQMRLNDFIDAALAVTAMQEPLVTRSRQAVQVVQADYFVEDVRRWLLDQYGEKGLYRGGLSVRTTLDPKMQAIGERALREGLIAYDRRHGYRGPITNLKLGENWAIQLGTIPRPPVPPEWRLGIVLKAGDKQAEIGVAGEGTGTIPLAELMWAKRSNQERRLGPAVRKASDVLTPGDVILVERLEEATQRLYGLRQIPAVEGGLVALDAHTGRVFALTGGFAYGLSEFNRATQASRQPGSSFKPFVYLAALDHGFTPASIIVDAPVVLDQGPGLPKWRPENYTDDYAGPRTLRYGLEQSRNLMTVQLAAEIGMPTIVDYARRFGVVDDMPPYFSMALGAGETTLIRMAAAYASFVNGGKRVVPALIERIEDKTGAAIYRRDTRPCDGCTVPFDADHREPPQLPDPREQIADPRSVYQIVSMLEGVVRRGTAKITLSSIARPVAGKTGTTNDFMDAWFVGFTPDLVVAAFIGFDKPLSLGKGETGGRVAAPVFRQFVEQALKDQPPVPFRVPPGIRFVRINAVTGEFVKPGDQQIIVEAFQTGTEPGRNLTGQSGLGADSEESQSNVNGGASSGSVEGLY